MQPNLLKHPHDIISGGLITNRSDGFVKPEEANWGNYLLTYEHDHLEMGGLNPDHNPANVYNLIADNIRLSEIKNNKKEAYKYGVEYLFNENH